MIQLILLVVALGGVAFVTALVTSVLAMRRAIQGEARTIYGQMRDSIIEAPVDYMDPLTPIDDLAEPAEPACQHPRRAVSVVPFAHSEPVRWICPDCGEDVGEPVTLGPYRRDATRETKRADWDEQWDTIQGAQIRTSGLIISATSITAERIYVPPVMSSPEAQSAAQAAICRSRAREVENVSPAQDGWRREADGSFTQLEAPQASPLRTRIR